MSITASLHTPIGRQRHKTVKEAAKLTCIHAPQSVHDRNCSEGHHQAGQQARVWHSPGLDLHGRHLLSKLRLDRLRNRITCGHEQRN